MGGDWQDTTLGSVVELKRGYDLPKSRREHGIVPIISSSGKSDTHSEAKVCGPGVVTGRYGTIGQVFFSEDDFWPLNTTLYVRDFKGNDEKFIYYFLKTIDYLQYSDKAAVPGVNRNHLHLAEVRVPISIEEQKAIAHILGTLDDKIELNRQMNATLEAMAQALFKSWFVDFDPVIDNALAAGNPIPEALQAKAERRKALGDQRKPLPEEIRNQFPNRFVFNEEMGWVPEGWEAGTLSNIATLETTSVHPNKEPEKVWTHYSIPAFDEGQHPSFDLGEAIKSGKYKVPTSAVLASKLNPQFPRVWMPIVIDQSTAVCSTEFMPFVPHNQEERSFLYALLCSKPIQAEIENRVTGSTGSRQRVKPKEIAELPLVVVPTALRQLFSKQAGAMFQHKAANKLLEVELVRTRDTLLPKLLSGQLRIPDAEKMVANL